MLLCLWKATKEDGSIPQPNLPHMEYTPRPDFQHLIPLHRTDDIGITQTPTDYESVKSEMSLPMGFGKLNMSNRRDSLQQAGVRQPALFRCLNLEARRNTARAFAGVLRPAASCMQRYKNFCDFVGRRPFPVAADAILLWICLLRPGGTSGVYLAHVTQAAILIRHPTDWLDAEIQPVSPGGEECTCCLIPVS